MNLKGYLYRLGLEGLETSDLTALLGLSRQRIYQLSTVSDDRAMKSAHVHILEEASKLATLAADFQVAAYLGDGPDCVEEISRKYEPGLTELHADISRIAAVSKVPSALAGVAGDGAIDAIRKQIRNKRKSERLAEHDWYLPIRLNALGVPPFPPVGEHSGKGFFALHNIAMREAYVRIRELGGSPLVTTSSDIPSDCIRFPDSTYWAGVWKKMTIDQLDTIEDVPASSVVWKWDFEPDLDGKAYAKLA